MTARTGTDTRNTRLLQLIGAVATFAILTAGVAVVFYESYREWGGLPSINGDGALLYGGVGTGFAVAVGLVAWAYVQWRLPDE